jgi:glycosyltransferase involved in cell wall biosynthesis
MQTFERIGARTLVYTAVSHAIKATGAPGGGDWRVVYNCARAEKYKLALEVDARTAPLLFLARLERCKGAHTAVEIARATGRKLIVAGNISTVPWEHDYYERELKPLFTDRLVDYVGPVDDVRKIQLLQTSAALLTPIEWDEPFPVTLPESLLCGTPVITFRRGGTPEGIDHGVTGFVCDSVADMSRAVGELATIDRARCRIEAEQRFTEQVITSAYEAIYQELAGRRAAA